VASTLSTCFRRTSTPKRRVRWLPDSGGVHGLPNKSSDTALEVLVIMASKVNRDNLLAVRLLQVRRHFNTCRRCKAAMNARAFDQMCDSTKGDLLFIALKWESNIAARLAAVRSADGLVFPCPDPNAHGAAYAATAEPVTITSTQGALF
jgi:hypothetical protein